MDRRISLMRTCPPLRSITAEQMSAYLRDGSFKLSTYGKNSIVHFSGEVCSKLEFILSGTVTVERIDEAGTLMTIAQFCGGDILGGNLLFSKNRHYPMTVTAKQPSTILEINKERLFALFADNHAFLRTYLESVCDHAAILGDRIQHYVNRTIRECVLSYLNYERQKQRSNRVQLTITKKALAEKFGVQRTSLSRELAKMKEDGLIRYDAKSIELL